MSAGNSSVPRWLTQLPASKVVNHVMYFEPVQQWAVRVVACGLGLGRFFPLC